jgi:hypothetical protein
VGAVLRLEEVATGSANSHKMKQLQAVECRGFRAVAALQNMFNTDWHVLNPPLCPF